MTPGIITISRQYGSGGRNIGHRLAEELNIPCYDREIIDKAADISSLSPDYIEQQEQQFSGSLLFDLASVTGGGERHRSMSMMIQIYEAEASVIRDIASRESCVIVGRCADKILEKSNPCLRLFLYADLSYRCKRASEVYGVKKDNLEGYVKAIDKRRARFFKLFHDSTWESALNYDLCFNTGKVSAEEIIDTAASAFSKMRKGDAK